MLGCSEQKAESTTNSYNKKDSSISQDEKKEISKDSSFDFTIYQSDAKTGEKKVVFLKNPVVFMGDGTKAAFYGKKYTLNFTVPNNHDAYPVVTDMKIFGFEPLEGKTYVNNGIPGHEFS
ncbi:hypothetical protein GOM49_14360 [Clostridium bovifaecis]|uniref:Uncharacterized protein n=1 Tax=Clostridium bovifaecis TaxID=2184719 RepID=A0A6I6F729_9CLOT|nr:hypothetical protein GOM49_14360 [Clostridium bovifaecis]